MVEEERLPTIWGSGLGVAEPGGGSGFLAIPEQHHFRLRARDDVKNVLNIQPVYPIHLSQKWNLINRVILPVIYQPELVPGQGSTFGLGDTSYTAFFSPREPGKLIWGVGPVISIPTSTDIQVGPGEWAAGPSVVMLKMPGSWVIGVLASNVWSFDSDAT